MNNNLVVALLVIVLVLAIFLLVGHPIKLT